MAIRCSTEALAEILRAARAANALSICVQTDLATQQHRRPLAAINDDLVDVLTVTMYGHSPRDLRQGRRRGSARHRHEKHGTPRGNHPGPRRHATGRAAPAESPRHDPRMEPFFDIWINAAGWAVIDAPTDKAGSVPFTAVVDMAPPKRRPCRRFGIAWCFAPTARSRVRSGRGREISRPPTSKAPPSPTMWHALNPILPPTPTPRGTTSSPAAPVRSGTAHRQNDNAKVKRSKIETLQDPRRDHGPRRQRRPPE